MTFGGKSGISGFYSNNAHRLTDAETHHYSQQVNVGKLVKYGETMASIESDNALHLMQDTARFLKIELERTGHVSNLRGYGTHLAFDCEDANLMQLWLWRNGINVMKCGPNTIGLRPALSLGCYDAAHLRNAMFHYNAAFVLNCQ